MDLEWALANDKGDVVQGQPDVENREKEDLAEDVADRGNTEEGLQSTENRLHVDAAELPAEDIEGDPPAVTEEKEAACNTGDVEEAMDDIMNVRQEEIAAVHRCDKDSGILGVEQEKAAARNRDNHDQDMPTEVQDEVALSKKEIEDGELGNQQGKKDVVQEQPDVENREKEDLAEDEGYSMDVVINEAAVVDRGNTEEVLQSTENMLHVDAEELPAEDIEGDPPAVTEEKEAACNSGDVEEAMDDMMNMRQEEIAAVHRCDKDSGILGVEQEKAAARNRDNHDQDIPTEVQDEVALSKKEIEDGELGNQQGKKDVVQEQPDVENREKEDLAEDEGDSMDVVINEAAVVARGNTEEVLQSTENMLHVDVEELPAEDIEGDPPAVTEEKEAACNTGDVEDKLRDTGSMISMTLEKVAAENCEKYEDNIPSVIHQDLDAGREENKDEMFEANGDMEQDEVVEEHGHKKVKEMPPLAQEDAAEEKSDDEDRNSTSVMQDSDSYESPEEVHDSDNDEDYKYQSNDSSSSSDSVSSDNNRPFRRNLREPPKVNEEQNESHSSDSALSPGSKHSRSSDHQTEQVRIDESEIADEEKQCEKEAYDILESLKIRDQTYRRIWIRKISKSKTTAAGKQKKNPVVQSYYHACLYCKKVTSNITKHITKHHGKEVQHVLDTTGKKERQLKWDIIRRKGDHDHNMGVWAKKDGEIILGRRVDNQSLDVRRYGPCPDCLVWITLDKQVDRHKKTCDARSAGDKRTRSETIVMAKMICDRLSTDASQALRKEVFPIMTQDSESNIAQNDHLIVALGNSWLRRNVGNKLKRKYYASSRMRQAARFLTHMCSLSNETHDISAFLSPKYFDVATKAALLTASQSIDDEEDLLAPSTAIKVGYNLKRLANQKLCLAIRKGDEILEKEARDMHTLMNIEWADSVTKLARVTLDVRRFNNTTKLPHPRDIALLQAHLKDCLRKLNLKTASPRDIFPRVVDLVMVCLMLFNKRRSGEMEAML